jgi:hypothetical protein
MFNPEPAVTGKFPAFGLPANPSETALANGGPVCTNDRGISNVS